MGYKRPFDNEELQELPFKNPRQFDYSNKLTQFADTIPCSNTPQKPNISVVVEGGFCKYQWDEAFESYALNDVTHLVDKDFESGAPLSLVTRTSSEEDRGTEAAAILPVSPEYFDFDFPRRMFTPVEDAYYLLVDRSPRKQVPLGPNHQAYVPSWDRHIKKDKFAQNDTLDTTDNDNEEIVMGTCVIPMPDSDLSTNNSGKVGAGRTDCSCLDRGSLRCVQQHVMEAREKLRKSLGHEKFVKLGFYDMGEDVAYKWSEEDEEIFREVVYANPLSLGKKFWKHLTVVFPSRSKRELVSYYFNVFILQRRAVQNRSSILDIDSDDDEWYGNQQAYEVQALEEDEDSAIESLADQEDLANHGRSCLDGDDDDDDDNDDDNGDSNGDIDVGDYSSAETREDYGVNLLLKGHVAKSFDGSRFDPIFQQTDNVSEREEDFNVQDDSCMSFEFQPNMGDSHSLIDTKANLHVSGMKTELSKCLQSKLDGSSELVSHVYLLDTCDAKIWDGRYPTASTKGIDLQPTCNIIEEIFGQDAWDNQREK
ncbi:uncharacterized protein LOC111318274 [Durio zibethinus]|uniref:Uncharacterized protein LOC111318274 n=1 Tax=Durio zibethinus TaxID=66656 RepID=A0A6P6BI41_DURZI|nr:uncharacterized protein LOC111318274 [Durio zibethinus]XP_022776771.1 uncharacterized protein LOC111318274 [Durio zibethinus]